MQTSQTTDLLNFEAIVQYPQRMPRLGVLHPLLEFDLDIWLARKHDDRFTPERLEAIAKEFKTALFITRVSNGSFNLRGPRIKVCTVPAARTEAVRASRLVTKYLGVIATVYPCPGMQPIFH